MPTVALIANGQIDSLVTLRPSILRHKRIIAVDGGLSYCHQLGIRPALIVGDFDSCPQTLLDQYEDVPKKHLLKEKDETDLEIAINEEFKQGAQKMTLFGAWGRRIDHSLTNLLLLTRHPGKIWMETEKEILFAIDGTAKIHSFVGQTLSLIPINGLVSGITTKGLKWELKESKMDQNFFGVSNVCLKDRIEISVKEGILVCCLIKGSCP